MDSERPGADQGAGTNACCPTGTWGDEAERVTTKVVYLYTQTLSQTSESSETETRIQRGGRRAGLRQMGGSGGLV